MAENIIHCAQLTYDKSFRRDTGHDPSVVGPRATVLNRDSGAPVIVERFEGKDRIGEARVAIVDGTVAGGRRGNELGSVAAIRPGDPVSECPADRQTPPPPAQVNQQPLPVAQVPERGDGAVAGYQPVLGHLPVVSKVRVVITAKGMGRTTTFAKQVFDDGNTLVIAFPIDGSMAIVEPPPASSKNPITVETGGKTYSCISFGLAFEDGPTRYVVLIKLS